MSTITVVEILIAMQIKKIDKPVISAVLNLPRDIDGYIKVLGKNPNLGA